MASSIAPSTILRSIAFSRATASAICKQFEFVGAYGRHRQSPLGLTHVLVVIQRVGVFARFRLPPRLLRRSDSQSSASVRTSLASIMSSIRSNTSASLIRAVDADARAVAFGAEQARRGSAGGRRSVPSILDLGDVAGIAVEIRAPHQRPVDARRGNFQPVGSFDRVGDVEYRRQRARGGLAVLDGHGAVRPLGHDLHRAAGKGGNAYPHQPIAKSGEHRLDDRGDARRAPRLGDEPRLVGRQRSSAVVHRGDCVVLQRPVWPQVIKKSGSRGEPTLKTVRIIRPL
jgi:hypothetical protein